jgi:hypothetical protein
LNAIKHILYRYGYKFQVKAAAYRKAALPLQCGRPRLNAGEDDLDAPDLATPTNQTSGVEKPKRDSNRSLNGGQKNPA